jgi:hypothetical protein
MFTEEDVDDIVFAAARDGDHPGAAARFEKLAEQREVHGEVSRAELLVAAGAQYGLAGDWDAAAGCYREAVADGGECDTDPRAWLHDALLRGGRAGEAAAVRAELKAARSTNPELYLAVGETLEDTELLSEAIAWFTMGYHRCERADVPDFMLDLLLVGRRRTRAKLGFPPDDLDEVAEEYMVSDA